MFSKISQISKNPANELFLMSRIIDNTHINIFVTTQEGTIIYANNFAGKSLEYSKDKLIGLNIESFISESYEGASWTYIKKYLQKEKKCEVRAVLLTKEGKELVCNLFGFAIGEIDDFKDNLFVLQFKDITHELKTYEELENKNIQITKINSELIKSNEELRRLSDLKFNFLSIASHELKTPLTSIKGYSDIIIDTMKEKIDDNVYRMIECINRSADRLHRVINNILDITRIEQKRLKLKPENIDLVNLVNQCADELSQFFIKRNIKFECVVKKSLPNFYGDPLRMQQVFSNLLTNAIKFSPDNSIVLVEIDFLDSCEFHIIVKDNGIGIPKEEQQKIFEPFYEIGSPTKHFTDFSKFMGGGTGLGLSIAKGIIERHGGKIWVESNGATQENPFPGSKFHILLPKEAKTDINDDETKMIKIEEIDNAKAIASEENLHKKPTILFIDNDLEAREISKMVLEDAFEILYAENSEKGLAMAFEYLPSLIIIDPSINGNIDGYRICRILKSQDDTRKIPIAFFSSNTQSSTIQKCFLCGADDYIVKPFSEKEILEKIWYLLMKKKEMRDL
jgi:PAS domain S-box-containing protein